MGCTQQNPYLYPTTPKTNVVDNYHGIEIPDPYRWLEDDMSEETAAWVKAQNDLTYSYLETIPFRETLTERMTGIWDYPKMGTPNKEGEYYFYSYNTGLQNQNIIYLKKGLDSKSQVFLDPNTFSDDGTVALSQYSISNDHKYMAYGISRGGSDWHEFYVKEIESNMQLEDHLEWIKFSGISWFKDGFFYTRYARPEEGDELKAANMNARIYYHRIGTGQSEDRLIHKDEANPGWGFGMTVSDDEKFMVLTVTQSTSGNAIAFRKSGIDETPFTWLDRDFDNDYKLVGNQGNMLYILTNHNAPRYKLIGVDVSKPAPENWMDILPEHDKNVLESVKLAGGKIIATYLQDAYHIASVYELDGSMLHDISLPGIGSLDDFNSSLEDNTAFYSYSSFNYPSTVFKYNVAENVSEVYYTPELDFTAELYETKQVFFTSKDGTKIPMFIVHKKGLEPDGTTPTLLYGYGGFNISMSPSFSTSRAVWLEQGGVFALANIRGGGEYGEEWHLAGTVLQKQNVFDDFIAAAEYLIDKKYTSSKRLAIYGGSNGGLLIGAVVNQRPELFAAAIPMVGVMDMLRFQKFTIGRYWTVDYGSSEDPEEFKYLLGYSPLHNISSDKRYPAIMVTTGDHDDRVVPAHSFKYAATLQEKYSGENPVMIRINTDAGHGAGKPTDMVIREYSDVWAFVYKNMDFTPEF
ncbi:MAG: prolyl oligopeptidase family serine peptidase [Bacteroidota bacterium]